jgi:hypothetical protein
MTMTSKRSDPSYGIPEPITKLTMEQDLKLRVLEDKVRENYDEGKEDIMTLLLALQHQNFVLGNSITNLVQKWPKPPIQTDQIIINEVLPMFGILLETKD